MKSNRIVINSIDRVDLIKMEDLMYIYSSGKYSVFVTSDNRKITSSSNIGKHLAELSDDCFFRIHNSYVVNIEYIKYVRKGENWTVILLNDSELPISRRKREELMKLLIA
jgi:two-component system LytT family response regulator